MSPALLNKYLQAAREVGDHMVLTPDGIDFAPYPMLVETDREKYAIQRIVDFYQRQPTDYADYFEAAWRYKYRAALGQARRHAGHASRPRRRSARSICRWSGRFWRSRRTRVGPVAKLQSMWRALPAPANAGQPDAARAPSALRCAISWSRSAAHGDAVRRALVKGLPGRIAAAAELEAEASTPRTAATAIRKDLRNDTDPPPVVPVIPKYPGLHQEAAPRWAALSAKARAGDPDLVVPAAERAPL